MGYNLNLKNFNQSESRSKFNIFKIQRTKFNYSIKRSIVKNIKENIASKQK